MNTSWYRIAQDNLYNQLERLRPLMAQKAQEIYNDWQQGQEGICEVISAAIQGIIVENIENANCVDDTVYNENESYKVEIPCSAYEKDGEKIENVYFEPNHVEISTIDRESPDNDQEEDNIEEFLFEPWKHTKKELLNMLLFHGTNGPIDGDLRGGGYDDIVWTAEEPSVAQNYIAESGGTMYVSFDGSPNDTVNLNFDSNKLLLEHMGYNLDEFDIQLDQYGRVRSWRLPKDKPQPTNALLEDYVKNTLGYNEKKYGSYPIKTKFINQKNTILPADYKSPGKLYMMIGKDQLKIYDLSDIEFDSQSPMYHNHALFQKLEDKGYDGFRMNDQAQSKNWGNVGHTSIGLFPSALRKVKQIIVDAVNFDWEENGKKLSETITPEFTQWHKQEVLKAIQEGKDVPEEVLKEYPDLTGK